MSIIIVLQILYAVIGAAYNGISIARVQRGGAPLSTTNPLKGAVIMATVVAVTLTQPYFHGVPYVIGWSVLIVFLGRGPVAAHFKAIRHHQNLDLYASPTAAYFAFLINAFGVVVGCIGVLITVANFFSA